MGNEPTLGCLGGRESRGWEHWLEHHKPPTRATERYVITAVYILFLLYYIGAVYLAWPAVDKVFISSVTPHGRPHCVHRFRVNGRILFCEGTSAFN
jgi:hypothetical protein